MKKIINWRAFSIAASISGLLALLATKWLDVNFWVAFVIVAVAMLINGWVAYAEDKTLGGFDNPKQPEKKDQAKGGNLK